MNAAAERIVRRFLTARIDVGKTIENGMVRIHRYRASIHVWDLTNAGKRGKKVERLTIMPALHMDHGEEERFMNNISTMIEGYGTLGSIVGTLKDYLRDHPQDLALHTHFERGVDVAPGGFKPIKIETDHISIEVGYKEFVVKNKDDRDNEPTCIPAVEGGLRGIPVFYRWVKDNEDSIKQMRYHDVIDEMSKLGIPKHMYCAMD
jgi:hypothetical protein